MKKLPDLYTNSFDKKIDNSLDYITISNDNKEVKRNSNYEIKRKIDNIFKSSSYIYKIKVEITLNDKVISENIVGRNNNKLITFDGKTININEIVDIKELV